MPDTHRVEIAGLVRELPLIEVAPGLRIAFLDSFEDIELIQATAHALAAKLTAYQPDILVTPEAKSIPLTYALALELGCKYVILRKSKKAYMNDAMYAETVSITSGVPQKLWVTADNKEMLAGKRVVLLDDVISTGSTLKGMQDLMDTIGANVVAVATIFTEGDPDKWPDVVSLGHLPLFPNNNQG